MNHGQFIARHKRNCGCQKMKVMKIFQENTAFPKLAEEWFRRGTVSEFENFDPARQKLFINLNPGLRKNAAVNDVAAKNQVGCVNYELKNTSNQNLDCVSSSNVKAQKLEFSKAIRVKIIARFLPPQVH